MSHKLPLPSITLDLHVVQALVTYQLNDLDTTSQDLGCCPTCCASCGALLRLATKDQLDELVLPEYRTDSVAYWDAEKQRVDPEWLAHAWRMRDCHADD